MSIGFMVVGLPRSGTTWAANWLTVPGQACVHDPLNAVHFDQWDAQGWAGVACTGIYRFPAWLNAHPARKVIVHRSGAEIAASLERLGLPAPPFGAEWRLEQVDGLHAPWSSLFDPRGAAELWAHLSDLPFDAERHRLLCDIHAQPRFASIAVDQTLSQRLWGEALRGA